MELFDIFEGKRIGKGKRSLAYRLRYRSATGTLTDEKVNLYHQGIREALRHELGAELRES